jgi:CRISPR system Cascade subunit CasE
MPKQSGLCEATVFLTQIIFSDKLVAQLRIRDAYDWHQRAWECFPGRPRDHRDFLTRIENKGDHLRLLILSQTRPSRPSWCPPEAWCGTKEINGAYLSHRRYRFQLCANPTKKVKAFNPDGSERPNGRRVPIRNRDELVAWIRRKGEQGGFSVNEDTLQTLRLGRKNFQKDGHRGLLNAVEFRGMLAVTDQAKFRETLARGVGPAKAFGFGLLAIAPA